MVSLAAGVAYHGKNPEIRGRHYLIRDISSDAGRWQMIQHVHGNVFIYPLF